MATLHRHVWEILEMLEQPSPAEAANDIGAGLTVETNSKDAGPVLEMHRRPVIVTKRCKICTTEQVERI